MFFRVLSFPRKKDKTFRQYLQIVETYREGGKVKQRILLSLGRVDELRASGERVKRHLKVYRFTT